MNLQLVRYCYGPNNTAGLLKFGDNLELSLWTLECPWQQNQIFVSCIPDGTYPLQKFDSTDHPNCWVITPVPGRTGILIHPGNKIEDTQGCILPGLTQDDGVVWNSLDAMRMLNYKVDRNAQHTIQIGSGLGAILMHDRPEGGLPGGGNGGNGEGELHKPGREGTDRSPGGTD